MNETFYTRGKQYQSLSGEATITRNGEILAENFPVVVSPLPNTGQYKYQTYRTYISVESLPIDGIKLDIGVDASFLQITNDDRIEYQSVSYNFNRSRDTKEVYLDKLVESKLPDDFTIANADEQTVLFNAKTQRAQISAGGMDANDNMFSVFIDPYDNVTVTDDSIRGEFSVRHINDENISKFDYLHSVLADITVTGLSGGVGDFVEIKSDDGTIYMKYQIGEKPKEKTYLVGTRDVSEFIAEGEDYFVGTPAEQEDFDRDDHDRYYKRIVVDDNGKVVFVIPIEDQMTAAINDAAAQLNDPDGDSSYFQTMSYNGMIRVKYDPETGTYSFRTGVLLDPVTWWVRSVLRPENCYVDIDATEGIVKRVIDETGNVYTE